MDPVHVTNLSKHEMRLFADMRGIKAKNTEKR